MEQTKQTEKVKNWEEILRKLIGARYFNKGYAEYAGTLNNSAYTARDSNGHGSTLYRRQVGTLFLEPVCLAWGMGLPKVPHLRPELPLIECAGQLMTLCFDSDILATFDVAIHDGVDVISVSLGGDHPENYFDSGISIGAFHAVKHGIAVVCSPGNSGPAGTVTNVAPWVITVGASTLD